MISLPVNTANNLCHPPQCHNLQPPYPSLTIQDCSKTLETYFYLCRYLIKLYTVLQRHSFKLSQVMSIKRAN
ncbi:hypothetical protein Hanom_Chr12g01085861 [Helianthus anomalus]